MPYKPHALIAFGGTLGSGTNADMWQCGVRVSEAPVVSDVELNQISNPLTDPNAYLNWIKAPLVAWFKRATFGTVAVDGMDVNTHLEYIKVNNIGPDGKYSDPGHVHTYNVPAPNVGTVNTTPSPQAWFVAPALTFRSNTKTRGRASHGRIYLPFRTPATYVPMLSTTQTVSYAEAGRDLLRVFNTDGAGVYPHPVRAAIHSKIGSTFALIDTVQCGNVLDVQRRRKNAIKETYSATQAV